VTNITGSSRQKKIVPAEESFSTEGLGGLYYDNLERETSKQHKSVIPAASGTSL
jgi:hypothetical protein